MTFQNFKVQIASIVLLVIVSLVYAGNQLNFSSLPKSQTSRAPASVGSVSMSSTTLNDKLAEEVAIPSAQRSLASIGKPADPFESLKYGALEGKYAFKTEAETITEISFIRNDSEKPTIIPDRADFLKRFAAELGVRANPKKLSSVLKGDHVIETYSFNANSGQPRLIQLTLGESNTLLNLKTQEAPILKLF